MRHFRRLSVIFWAALSSILVASSSPVSAQIVPTMVPPRTFEADLFQSAIGPRNFLSLDAPEVPGHKQLSFGLMFDYQRNAYDVYTTDGAGKLLQTSHLIASQYRSELQAAMGLLDRFQIGMSLPITFWLDGDDVSSATGLATGSRYSTAGLGDLRIEGKGQLKTVGEDDQFVLAGLVGVTAPTGKSDSYLGNRGPATARAKVLASLQLGRFRVGGQFGFLVRETTTTLGVPVGSQMLYGGAGSVQLLKGFEALVEVAGRSGLADFAERWWDENPFEVDFALRAYPIGMVGITAGGGMGLGKGIGAPRGRLFLGAVFTPDFRDADHDGVYDTEDRCPDQAEDRDGFRDKDGCPEPDNDSDGSPDISDRCPNDAEDLDQFEDADGCPELDNDKDGIPDLNDPCPNAAEDRLGKRPKDGCPSTADDTDGDGVNDAVDKCPDEPEDRDIFEDEDGCPDPDNDGDGIPDSFDTCPSEAEDADSFEDEDGCPESDNDKDGFLDASDKCPDKAETLNGTQDDDGCPDAGAEIVKLGDDAIEVIERLHFVTRRGKSELKESAANAIGLVALVLKGHPEIKKLRIEVRADGVSKQETQWRADLIRDVLVLKGIDTKRLVAAGAGTGGTSVSFTIAEKAVPKPALAPAPETKPSGTPEGAGTPF